MGLILLFHSGVVIFSVSSRAGEADGLLSFAEVMHQMPVEELASVIGIKAQDEEGQGRFDLRDALRYCGQAPVGNGARLSPLGVHIGGGDAPAKFPRHALSAVRHGVGFDKPRTAHLPVLGANGDLTAQHCRTSAAAARLRKVIRQGASNRSIVAALAASTFIFTLLSNWLWRFS